MEKTKKRFWPILLLAIYLAVNMALILHHENWRDEAQAWQIAGLLDLKGLFAQLKYEGHPCLWYLILMPFAKLHAPFGIMNDISLVLMAVAAYAPERTLWYPLTEAPITFSVWNESREETIGYEEMLERIRSHYPEVQSFWLLTGGQNNIEGLEEALADTVPVFREDALISEESVRIYDISGF